MARKTALGITLALLLTSILYMVLSVGLAAAWSNGGYSAEPSNPNYGTHDWIAQHALDWLPMEEKWYILDNLAGCLYGTELPDKSAAPDGIGDTVKHHIYYWSDGSLQDDASAIRASQEYVNVASFLEANDYEGAARSAGIMSHYIADMSVFGHVMAGNTDWGAEVHHSDYEAYVNQRTSSYSSEFDSYLSFDGALTAISAYDAAMNLAYDTTFDFDGDLTCVWMDQHYDWNNPSFKNRAGESLNLAVNYLADVLHTLAAPLVIPATVDTNPHTLNLKGRGKWVTAYIQLPEGYNPEDIDASTILLNGTIPPVLDPKYDFVTNSSEYLVDHNNDGIPERMVKFNRTQISEYIVSEGIIHGDVTLTLTGQFTDETLWEGNGAIIVTMPGDANVDGKVDASDLFGLGKAYSSVMGDTSWNIICDFNEDSIIDTSDLSDLITNYGKTSP